MPEATVFKNHLKIFFTIANNKAKKKKKRKKRKKETLIKDLQNINIYGKNLKL